MVLSLMLRPRGLKRGGDGSAPASDYSNLDRPIAFHQFPLDGHSIMNSCDLKVHTQVDRPYVVGRLISSVDGGVGISGYGSIFVEQSLVRDVDTDRL